MKAGMDIRSKYILKTGFLHIQLKLEFLLNRTDSGKRLGVGPEIRLFLEVISISLHT